MGKLRRTGNPYLSSGVVNDRKLRFRYDTGGVDMLSCRLALRRKDASILTTMVAVAYVFFRRRGVYATASAYKDRYTVG